MFKKYNKELEVINTFMDNNPKCTTDQLANTIQMVVLRMSNRFVDYNMCYEAAQGLLDLYDNPELTDEEMTELIEDDYRYPDEDEEY